MDPNSKAIESIKKAVATAASLATFAVLVRSLINGFIPCELRNCFSFAAGALRAHFHSQSQSQHTIIVKETELGDSTDQIYDASKTYLLATRSMRRLRVSCKGDDDQKRNMTISLEEGVEMIDVFEGIAFKWQLQLSCRELVRSLELSFHKKHKEFVLNSYLPYILDRSKEINSEDDRTLKLYTNEGDSWTPTDFHHPTTFDTLAMDSEVKNTVMEDLGRFVGRKEYYRRMGKAWKRGYLLHGPLGTGKTSLVAAMANYVKFDIYNLELTELIRRNSRGLRRLLVGMGNKSILVVEDIDRSLVTLQWRLLNFVDGLWSTISGEEMIIVFIANYKERLDPALLWPGRMDMHVIHMACCGASGFRTLQALTYDHRVNEHPLLGEIEGLIEEVEVTPEEEAMEELMRSDDTDIALGGSVTGSYRGKEKEEAEGDVAKDQ